LIVAYLSVSSSPKENGVKRLRTDLITPTRLYNEEASLHTSFTNGVKGAAVNGYSHAFAPPESASPESMTDLSMSVDEERPAVTIAMLRALTASVRKKYGTAKK
jgi:hypothetical protein